MNLRLGLVVATCLCTALACGGGDAESGAGALTFHDEVNPLGDYRYDTGLQPAGSPVQVQFLFASDAKLTVDAQGVATEAGEVASKPGSGKLALRAKFLLQANLKVDVSGLKYDGEVPGLDAIDIAFGGEQTFDPFALEAPVTVSTSIPETKLPDIPLPGGLPGVLSLTITSESVLASSFQGVCVASDGKKATYTGGSTTTGTIAISPTVVLKIPIVGDKTFALPIVHAPIPGLEAAIDLGPVDVGGTGAAPSGAEVIDRKSCTEEPDNGTSSGGASSGGASSGGASSGGPDAGPTGVLACADNTVTLDSLLPAASLATMAQRGSCTGAQLDAFAAAVDASASADVDALYNSVSGACQTCIFTELQDQTVPAELAAIGHLAGEGYFPNDGWCVGNRVGSPKCGQAQAAVQLCGLAVCIGCGTYDQDTGVSDAEQQACIDKSYLEEAYVCATSVKEDRRTICGSKLAAAQDFCNQLSLLQQVQILCGN